MLNKNTKITLLVFAIIILVYFGIQANNKRYEPKYKWIENYVYKNDQPYGTNILYELLASYSNNQLEIVEKENLRNFLSEKDTVKNATYFVIGNHCNYGIDDIVALKQFAKKGNTVFMSLNELPSDFLEEFDDDCFAEFYGNYSHANKLINAHFTDSSLSQNKPAKFYYENLGEKKKQGWNYFEDGFCDGKLNYVALGNINRTYLNYIKLKMGKGQILIHANPLFFTNLHIIRPEGAMYAEQAFSYFPEGPIYWDRNSKLWSITNNNYSSNKETTPFAYILQQKEYKWAFYLIWVLIIIFVLFNLWRKQRSIPVKFPKNNSTLEFVHTIGELYFSQKNNRKLALQKMDLFLISVRSKYAITEKDEDKFINLLSKKSAIPLIRIQNIFDKYKTIKNSSIELDDDNLIRFYKLLEAFKKQSK